MIHSFLIGVGSFCLLLLASWFVAEGGEILGHKYDASVIGGILIAWLNTAPETIFLLRALMGGNPSFAAGAISGSSIVVSTIALGCCIYIGSSKRRTKSIFLKTEVRWQCFALAVSVIVASLISVVGFNPWLGFLGVCEYVVFLVYTLQHSRRVHHTDARRQDFMARFIRSASVASITSTDDEQSSSDEDEVPLLRGWLYLGVGGGLIMLCSDPFIQAVMGLAYGFEVSPVLLAFLLAPLASEAPEILESITLSRRGRTQSINIAFSNLVGGTVTKTTLLVGIYSIFGYAYGYKWEQPSFTVSFLMLALCAGFAGAVSMLLRQIRQRVSMWFFGVFLLTAIVQSMMSIMAEHYVDDIVPSMSSFTQ